MLHCPGAHVDRGQHAQQHAQVFLQLRVVAAEQILRPLQLRGIVGIVGNLGRDILGHQILAAVAAVQPYEIPENSLNISSLLVSHYLTSYDIDYKRNSSGSENGTKVPEPSCKPRRQPQSFH